MDSGSACTGDVSFDDGLGLQLNITTLPQSNIELSTLKMDCDTNRTARCRDPLSILGFPGVSQL